MSVATGIHHYSEDCMFEKDHMSLCRMWLTISRIYSSVAIHVSNLLKLAM